MFSAGAAMGVKYQLAGAMAVILVPSLVAATEARVEVDANLVTALDISHSVGRYEEWVEREGLAQAVTHPRFIEAVRTGFHGQIGFAILIWSSHGHMKTLVPWTTIATPEDAMRVSQRLRSIHLIEESQLLDRDIPTDHYEAPKEQHQTDIALRSTRPQRSLRRLHPRAAAPSSTSSATAQATAGWSPPKRATLLWRLDRSSMALSSVTALPVMLGITAHT
jgi:hypothetical protein